MANCCKNILQLLTTNGAFCNFCLKALRDEESSYSFEDDVTLCDGKFIKLCDLSSFILGFEVKSYRASGILCKQCVNMLITTCNFVQMCKYNTHQLYNSVISMECRMNQISNVKTKNSLYIVVDRQSCICQCIFDIKPEPNNHSTALKMFVKDSDDNFMDSPESELINPECILESKHYDSSTYSVKSKGELNEKRQNKKRNRLRKIPLSELLSDIKNLSQYKCKICFKIYSNLYRLKQHFLRIHAPKEFVCNQCLKGFGSAALLTQHKHDSHNSLICSDCGKSYTSRSTFKTHVESHNMKLICQVCGKVFKTKRSFSKHLLLNNCNQIERRVNLEKKYECNDCNKKYNSKSTLQSHIKFEHGNGKAHVCSWCNKKFNAVSRLTAHVVTHTQEKKFSCNVCGGQFVTKESLAYHIRIHTGERPYQCEHCDKKFLSTSRRAEHVRRHHSDEMINCDLCNSKFRSRSCLVRHRKRHYNPNSRLHYARLVSNNEEVNMNFK